MEGASRVTSPKGYPLQEKLDRIRPQFATVEPVRVSQHGLSVLAHMYVYEVGTDAVEASSTEYVINATAHAAKKGDVIRFTSGALSGIEVKVYSVTTNAITLAETLASAPATAVTFQILRHKYPVVNSAGELNVAVTPAPIQFVLDGVDTEVNEDTITPANNRPLPVKLTGVTGDINITAGDLNVSLSSANDSVAAVQSGVWDITDITGTVSLPTGASTLAEQQSQTTSLQLIDDAIATIGAAITTKGVAVIGTDGTDARVLKTDVNGELQIDVLSSALPTGAATETTLASVDGKLNSLGQKLMAASVPVVVASDQGAFPVTDNGGSLTIDGTVAATQSGAWDITDITGTISLPTGAATETTLASIDGKLNSLGQKAMANSVPVTLASDQTALPITDNGGSLTIDGTVAATQSGAWTVIPTYLDVVDFIDTTPILDTSSSNIAGSASLPTEVVATLAADVKKVQFLDTTGAFIGLYTGAASSEVLQAVFGPGSDQTIEVQLSSGARVSLKRLDSTTAISSGIVSINFIG